MSNDDHFILFSDIKELFCRSYFWIIVGVLVFGVAGFWVRSQVPVKHKIHAIFKDHEKNSGETKSAFNTLLKSIDVSVQKEGGHVLLTSTPVIQPVIEQLGLQGVVQERSILSESWLQCRRALSAELRVPLVEEETFSFKEISYSGERVKRFKLFFRSKEHFELRDRKERLIAIGEVGIPLTASDVTFTIETVPSELKLRFSYPFSILPFEEVCHHLLEKLETKPDKTNSEFIHIYFTDPKRCFGKKFVNALMESYRRYLLVENQSLTQAQMTYLEKRRDEYCQKMDGYLQTHVNYMKESLKERGAFTLGQHLPFFQERRLRYTGDLHALEMKRRRLSEADPWTFLPAAQDVGTLQDNLHTLSKEKDELSLALSSSFQNEEKIGHYVKQLDTLQKEKLETKAGIHQFFASLAFPNKERERMLLSQQPSLLTGEDLSYVQNKKKRFHHLLGNTSGLTKQWCRQNLRLLTLQEEVLKKRLIAGIPVEQEYQGIDLKTARTLLLNTINKRDETDLHLNQMQVACRALEKDDVEYISLTAAFPDGISQGFVREMGELNQKLQRERDYTERESERLERKLQLKTNDLKRHMKETIALTQSDLERLDQRIQKIQRTIVDLLGQEIALVEKQIQDRIDEQLLYLDKEEELIRGQLYEVKSELSGVPDLWLKERQLQFSADLNQGMLESLVKLVESKNIENDVSILKAKPINPASTPIKAKSPLLCIFGGIGGLIGGMIVFAFLFFHALHHGFPMSLKNLRQKGKKVLGTLKRKEALETLRHLSLLLEDEQAKVISLIMGTGQEFVTPLADLIASEKKQVLVIDFSPTKKIKPNGLAAYLEGKMDDPNIQSQSYGGRLSFAGSEEKIPELVKQKRFQDLIEKLKKSYDYLLLAFPVSSKKVLPKVVLPTCDHTVIRLDGDSMDDLSPYFEWERKGKSLAFLR